MQDADDGEYCLTVHTSAQCALLLTCLLAPHHLCSRIDLGVVDDSDYGLQIVRV